ncbi:hypothetical protein CPB83DRAFT_822882 [Crepidotus variabilis]|uniref:Uncharacterized protein n=1 Tax=Crepidotus variabilis TaxID=179855 RepID=A0A9P6JIS0_9AGAR|nr:hypothetical protein CPB83DRAFT_822882 [Crepidotus variabilis]
MMLGTIKFEAHQNHPSPVPCWFWLGVEGSCPDGELCKFSHDDQQHDRIAPISMQAPIDHGRVKRSGQLVTQRAGTSIKENCVHNVYASKSNCQTEPVQYPIKGTKLTNPCRFCSSITCIGGIRCLLSNGKLSDVTPPKVIPDVAHLLAGRESDRKNLSNGDNPKPVQRLTEEQQKRIIEKRKMKEAENQRVREEQQKRILEERKNKEGENRRLRELFEQEKRKNAEEKRQQEQEELFRREQQKKRREEERRMREHQRQTREEERRKKEEERQDEVRRQKDVLEREHERAIQLAKDAKWTEEAKVVQQFAVGESSLITCAAGLDINHVIAGFELCRIRITNLPLNTNEDDISELFIQQGEAAGEFFVLEIKRPRLTNRLEATALVSSARGETIAHGLDGLEFHGEILIAAVCKSGSGLADRNTPVLMVSWAGARVQTETLIATYPSRADAETWARRIDGTVWNGFKLKAVLNGSKRSFEVTISNCPPGLALKPLDQDMVGTNNIQVPKITVQSPEATVLGVVRDHVVRQTGAKEDSYRITFPDLERGNTKLTINFDTWDNLKRAYSSVHQQQLRFGDGNLSPILHAWHSEPHHYSCWIPTRQYVAQQTQWDALSEKAPGKEAWVHVQVGDKPDMMLVRVLGKDERAAGVLKIRAESLVSGEILDVTQWHSSFLTREGRKFFDKVYDEAKVYVRSDLDTRTLTVFGEPEAIHAARMTIRQEVEHKTAEEMVWMLDRQAVGFFVRVGVGRLKELVGDDNVSLQLACRPAMITIKGGDTARHHVHRLLEESRAKLDVPAGDRQDGELCPVCNTEPTAPEQLGCGHTYCAGCLQHFLTSAGETKTFPLLCTGNEAKCNTPISLPFVRRFMSVHAFKHLVEVAFACYLERHPQELKYCTTPDCKQLYRRLQPSQNIHCPSCFKPICSACDDEPHEKMSCEENRLYRNPEERDRRNEMFMAQRGFKKCPSCSRWIEKNGGCNHMSCRCGAQFNWM